MASMTKFATSSLSLLISSLSLGYAGSNLDLKVGGILFLSIIIESDYTLGDMHDGPTMEYP